jgi:uncharacterized protein YqjF (DUF2071 family)
LAHADPARGGRGSGGDAVAPAVDRRPVGFQQWRDLLFLHWAMPPEAVRPRVPAGLALDLLEGRAWVTLIPFAIPEARPAGLPRALSTSLLEVNCRTYVRGPDGEAGIYFWSLEASSLPAVAGARLLYGLPYFPASMSTKKDAARVEYTSRRCIGPSAGLYATWSVGPPDGTAAPGTRDHFLVERYTLYVERAGAMYRARVRHAPYPLHQAAVHRFSESILAAAGVPRPHGEPLVHFSPGVDVDIFWLERVPGGANHPR